MRRIFCALMVAGTVAVVPPALSHSAFSHPTEPAFSSSPVELSAGLGTRALDLTNMAPGDAFSASLVVSDPGSTALRYSLVAELSGSNALSDALSLTIKSGVRSCSIDGSASGGSTIYAGRLSGAEIGDPAQGAQPGDRTLPASASEDLCFQVSLPLSAANSLRGRTAIATFSFQAEQTADD